jgi:hypothetical protein
VSRFPDGFDREDPAARAELLDRVNADDLPSLAGFFGAYLHEDWQLDFGSAAEAAFAFLGDADLDDVEELAADWELLVEATRDLDLAALNRLLRERFRSGWHLASKDELQAVTQELDRARRE